MKLLRSDIDPLCPVVSLSFAEEQERTYLKMEKETAASKNNNEYKSPVSLAAKVTTNLKSDNVRGLAPSPTPLRTCATYYHMPTKIGKDAPVPVTRRCRSSSR